MPGWPSWLGRETHRVNTIIARFLRHLEVAGSNPAPGTYRHLFTSLTVSKPISLVTARDYSKRNLKISVLQELLHIPTTIIFTHGYDLVERNIMPLG